jgi:hypothetical protein
MRRSAMLVAALGLGLAAPVLAQGSQARSGDLKWKLSQGDSLRYSFTWVLEEKTDFVGGGGGGGMGGMGSQTQSLEVGYTLDQKVQSVDGGVATIEAAVGTIRGRLGMGMMGELSYDSAAADTGDNPMAWMRHLVGKKFRFKLSPRGEVTEVSGGDALRAEVIEVLKKEQADKPKKGPGGGDMGGMGMMDPAAMIGMIAESLTVVFTDQSLKSSLQVMNDVLPEGAAKEGDTWKRPVVEILPKLGTMKFTAQFTHRGGAGAASRITSRADGEMELVRDQNSGGNPLAQMLEKRLEVKRKTATGTASFNGERGRLLDSELVQEIVMEGPLPPEAAMMFGEEAKDMKINRTIALTMRYVEEAPGAAKPADKPKGDGSKF